MTFSSAATAASHDYPQRLPGRPKSGSVDAMLEAGRQRFMARQALYLEWNCFRDDSGLLKTQHPRVMASGPIELRLEFCSADGWYCRTESAVCYWNGHNFIYWPKNADEATRIFWRKARKLG